MTRSWLPPRTLPSAEWLLICLPHAGGGALAYHSWRREFAPDIEVLPALLPGREHRGDEQPVSDTDALVTALAAAAVDRADRPFAIYGHSMGALLAFELAHALTARGRGPGCLVVSGCDAPHRHAPAHDPDDTDEELTAMLLDLGGTAKEIVSNPKLLGAVIRPLRADLALEQAYRFRPRPPLDAPVTVVAGSDDPYVTPDGLAAWSELTRGRTQVELLRGGHFLRGAQQQRLLAIIGREVRKLPTLPDQR